MWSSSIMPAVDMELSRVGERTDSVKKLLFDIKSDFSTIPETLISP
jgi:hypothetical protein